MTDSTNTAAGDRAAAHLSALTVNEIIARWPASIGTLNALGIDTCCGGGATLGRAAAELSLDEEALVARVHAATHQDLPR